jgi:putative ABC transport system ATP-binding protein
LSSLIKLEHVTKTYHVGGNEFHALKGIDFELQAGEMTAIVGVSGSGKSTLMNILGFLDHCTSGRYLFADEDVSRLNDDQLAIIRNQQIGFVFQSFFLLPRMDAVSNVMLPLFYRETPRDQAKEAAMRMLDKVGIAHLANNRPNQLSGGQQQRVAIARALVTDPKIILADEPTGALDSQTSQDVMELLINLNKSENRTILIITHDTDVSRQCRRVVTIKDGLIATGA